MRSDHLPTIVCVISHYPLAPKTRTASNMSSDKASGATPNDIEPLLANASTNTFRFRDLLPEIKQKIFDILAEGQHPRPHLGNNLLILNKSCYRDFAPSWYKRATFRFSQHQDVVNKLLRVPPTRLCFDNLRHLQFSWLRGWDFPLDHDSKWNKYYERPTKELATSIEMLVNVVVMLPQLAAVGGYHLGVSVLTGFPLRRRILSQILPRFE